MGRLFIPTLLSYGQMSGKNRKRQSKRNCNGRPRVAVSPILRSSAKAFKKATKDTPTVDRKINETSMGCRNATSHKKPDIGFDRIVRHLLCARDMSKNVAEHFANHTFRPSTRNTLNVPARRWAEFCKGRKQSVLNFNIQNILDFLEHNINTLKISYRALKPRKLFAFHALD